MNPFRSAHINKYVILIAQPSLEEYTDSAYSMGHWGHGLLRIMSMSENDKIAAKLAEHFSRVYNHHSYVNPEFPCKYMICQS